MNKYDERYDICLAKKYDIEEIMDYIDRYWKKGHILAVNRKFFEYEFVDGEDVHFILVRDKKNNNAIAAMCGYYLCSKDKENLDMWGSMWSVRKDIENLPFIGVEIVRRERDMLGCRSEIGVGDNEETAIPVLQKVLKHRVGKLEHYYMLNDVSEYKVAKIENKVLWTGKEFIDNPYVLKPIDVFQLEEHFNCERYKKFIPYKDNDYIKRRFFEHPIYQYRIYGICSANQEIEAVVVFREIEYNQRKILRLVDYIGNKEVLRYMYAEFKKLLNDDTEYIDFYCLGFDEIDLQMAGFVKRREDDENIIPNYFEPFLQKNIEIWFNSTHQNVTICKADADQDRPSIG